VKTVVNTTVSVTPTVTDVLDQMPMIVSIVYQTLMKTIRESVSVSHGIELMIMNMEAAGVEITVPNGMDSALMHVAPVPTDTSQNNVKHVCQMHSGTKTVSVNVTQTGLATTVMSTLENVTNVVTDVLIQAMMLVTNVPSTPNLRMELVCVWQAGPEVTVLSGRAFVTTNVKAAMTRHTATLKMEMDPPTTTVSTV